MKPSSPLTIIDSTIPSDGYVVVKLSNDDVMVFNDLRVRRGQRIEQCVGDQPSRKVLINGVWFSEGRAMNCVDQWRQQLLYIVYHAAILIVVCCAVWVLAVGGYHFLQDDNPFEVLELARPSIEALFASIFVVLSLAVGDKLFSHHLETKRARNDRLINAWANRPDNLI